MIRRCEIIIVPDRHPAARASDALARELGTTLERPVIQTLVHGGWTVILATDAAILPTPRGEAVLIEGSWPDPPGLRVLVDRDRWAVEADASGVRPVYWSDRVAGGPVVSTRPELIAALDEGSLDPQAIAEQLLLGFTLGRRTLFAGVHRLRPGCAITGRSDGRFRITEVPEEEPATVEPADWIERAAAAINRANRYGAALELSGGVDSRLMLAIARRHDVVPELAFTLGDENDEDVTIARELCGLLRLDHVAIAPSPEAADLESDARHYVTRAGFAVSACTGAAMPGAFRTLAPFRGAQVGGGGGECATGFYYSPFDALLHTSIGRRAWVNLRLFNRASDLDTVFEPERARELREAIIDTVIETLEGGTGPWRRRTDQIYLTERIPNAGGPVLSASAAWYHPIQPLLHRPHLQWARERSVADRGGRRAQLRLLHDLDPELASVPFSARRRFRPGSTDRLHQISQAIGKTSRRITGRSGPSDLGAPDAARVLRARPSVRADIGGLVDHADLGIRDTSIAPIFVAAEPPPHLTGTLLSASWADSAMRSARSLFARATIPTPSRRAA